MPPPVISGYTALFDISTNPSVTGTGASPSTNYKAGSDRYRIQSITSGGAASLAFTIPTVDLSARVSVFLLDQNFDVTVNLMSKAFSD